MIDQLPANMQAKIALELCPVAGLPDFCWAWTGHRMPKGYGQVSYQGRSYLAHRLAYQLLVGPIADELQLDHLCLNKPCCNPSHTEPVTGKVNCERTEAATKPRCKSGHPLAGPNLRLKKKPSGLTQRQCRVCEIDANHRHNAVARTGKRAPYKSSEVKRAAKRAQIIAAAELALAETYAVAA